MFELNGIVCPIIGDGGSGVVVLREGIAVKLPRSYIYGLEDDHDDSVQREKEVFRRLKHCSQVVQCLDVSGPGIEMEWMENGNLRDYLHERQVSPAVQLSWFRKMARGLSEIHHHRVIVADIHTRNFLVARDVSIKFSDFSESSVMEPECDMRQIDDNGYSIYTDMGQLAAVMYEIITGEKCDFDLFKDQPPGPAKAAWPRREDLPRTQGIWLGSIIEKCWTKGAFQTSLELSLALELATEID
ncbi:hypothetical protein HRR83_000278 [Exophiala dermatitidis]|uniref:Protein kinase domain-containing protein n=2 Tax=Exophiala dermatitidis TaxID=5970 RepID=H6C8U5_EXODN|nr:uncharacterized protein HMPREF1120_08478 [Exophiala dermatitidis NIH/UT8656]KAJ4523631.1 hypothetical protein HRR73_002814 [Exophiala dermatitidis]EHY60522.1 hypothetical protein HMPREF1120_08478 [Exophiala dermatitidis NIH/UT8656]KAJ4524657.1 hypothetical protein HRR75_000247 [Exophiala dermatitidis]KAJ4527526.1 hypothetical protein HRR74_000280 [Exophiala dermatitidis]KAJ4531099.1 hypothetical protein HRR76_008776 [Exophiala dermatitidis]